MVVYQASQEVADRRRHKLCRERRKKGRKPSEEALKLQEYTLFITNIPRTVCRKEMVGTIYRVRWQIELIFKQWKQLFRIDVMKGTRVERIRCLVYSRLITILIVNSLFAESFQYTAAVWKREISPVKFIQWLRRDKRLSEMLFSCGVERLLDELSDCIPRILLKQKRKRKTSLELLQLEIGFIESFGSGNT